MLEPVVAFITASSLEEGRAVAQAVLHDRLAACVNIVPAVESHYWWQGKIEDATEVMLVVKTRRDLVDALTERVKQVHSYTVPEVIALPIHGGNPDYLNWLNAETRPR